jgi:hypothetical protein
VATSVLIGKVGLPDATLNLEITTITNDKIALHERLEKSADAPLLREMIGYA